MQVLNLDIVMHNNVTTALAKGASYPTPEGFAVVFFDKDGNYYTPLDLFMFKAEAEEFIAMGLKDGVNIS